MFSVYISAQYPTAMSGSHNKFNSPLDPPVKVRRLLMLLYGPIVLKYLHLTNIRTHTVIPTAVQFCLEDITDNISSYNNLL